MISSTCLWRAMLPTLTPTTARTRLCSWENLSVWTARFTMCWTGERQGWRDQKYLLSCQVCVLGQSQGWSYSHRGRGSVHLRPQVATVSGTLHTGNNNGSFINWYWWIVERRGEEGLSIKPVICYQTFPGYPQSSTGDWTSGVWGQNVWNIFYFLIPPGRLSRVEPGDEGQYECQVSTETKLSTIKHLQVIQPQVSLRLELPPISTFCPGIDWTVSAWPGIWYID